MWKPRANPPLGGRAAGRGGGGHVLPIVDRFAARRRLGRRWPQATGRWSGDPMPSQQGSIGADDGAGGGRTTSFQPSYITIKTCFSRRKNLTMTKKGIGTCFSTRRNLTAARKTCKHVFAGTKIYYDPNPNLASHLSECIINRETMRRT